MLQNIKNDLMYLLNILESIEKIQLYSMGCADAETFFEMNNQLNFNGALNLFTNIGENITKISDELKRIYASVDWKQIKGFRNMVVHDYVNIDTFKVFDIIVNDLEPLKKYITNIISTELKKNNFDIEEYNEAKKSFYYRHIDFNKII